MQKERLMNEFTTALNNFQSAQRKAAEKEKASVARARAHSSSGTGGVSILCCLQEEKAFFSFHNFLSLFYLIIYIRVVVSKINILSRFNCTFHKILFLIQSI